MFSSIKRITLSHISRNRIKYFFLLLAFIIGIGSGALLTGAITQDGAGELTSFIDSFCQSVTDKGVSNIDVFTQSLLGNLRLLIILWICSCSYLLVPIPFLVVALRGFGIGFSLGFLTFTYGAKGLVLLLVSVLPQGIIALPVLFFLSLTVINHAYDSHKRGSKKTPTSDGRYDLRRRAYYFALCGLALFFASLIDGFIAPVFIKSVCSLFL